MRNFDLFANAHLALSSKKDGVTEVKEILFGLGIKVEMRADETIAV